MLKDIQLEEIQQKVREYNLELQEEFLKCIRIKIENAKEKEEIIDLICMMRYYNYLYIDEETLIKDTQELQLQIQDIEDILIKKAYELKVLNKITNNKEENNKALKIIFTTKIIDLENVNIELRANEKALEIDLYDGEVFEKTVVIPIFNKENIVVKLGKRIKIIV